MAYRTIGGPQIAPRQAYNEPIKPDDRTTRTDAATMALRIGDKAYKFREGIQKRRLESSGLLTDPKLTFRTDPKATPVNIFKQKPGLNVGRWSKRYEVDPRYYENLKGENLKSVQEGLVSDLQASGNFTEKQINDLMGVNNRDFNAWRESRGGEGTVTDYLSEVQRGNFADTYSGGGKFLQLESPINTGYRDAFDIANQATFDSLGLPSDTTFPIPKTGVDTALDTVDWAGNIKKPKYDIKFTEKSRPEWGTGKIGDKTDPGFFKRIGTDEGFFKRLGRGEGPVGKKLSNIASIGKGGVKNLWQESAPGKIIKAFGQTKGAGGPGFFKALFPGAKAAASGTAAVGGTAAGTAAAGAGAGAQAGLFASMGPVGWTMLAASLLSNKKLLRNLGKIFSDERLKENITKVGKSPSGINVYEFNYKGQKGRYRGVLANEVPWAASKDEDGFKMVDYSQVDVPFEKVN